jgi:Fic family protein
MNLYNWQQKDWPAFSYSLQGIEDELFMFIEKVGRVTGVLHALPEDMQMDAVIDMMVSEAIKTSAIEGEYISRKDVTSSIKNNLGLNAHPEKIKDKLAEGIGDLMVDVRKTFREPLTQEKLFRWHTMLLMEREDIKLGGWRDHKEPMQVVSGASGKQKIHFEAPPSGSVPKEMERFIIWFNDTGPGGAKELKKAPVRSAIAHLYFEAIHPFEDGNGRIGRAIAEKALSQGIGRPVLMSLSKTIEANKKSYYDALESAQRSNEITGWINYFVSIVLAAQIAAEEQIDFTLKKAKFFDRYKHQLSDRQIKVIRRMLEEGPEGFSGGMNATKYASLTQISKATATRDLQDLLEKKVFVVVGAGRSTRYQANI